VDIYGCSSILVKELFCGEFDILVAIFSLDIPRGDFFYVKMVATISKVDR